MKGKIRRFPWVTDLPLGRDTVMSVMRCGRRRWATGNETFQTLKARDLYRFEHNFGHGKNHLSDVFATLAMLAFLIDQVQQHCCPLFRRAREHRKRILYLWNRMRELVRTFAFPDWETLYRAIAGELGKEDHVCPSAPGRSRPGHARTPPIPPFAETSPPGQPPGRQPCATGTARPCSPPETVVAAPTFRLSGIAA